MSRCSVASLWFDLGSTWSLNPTITSVTPRAAHSTGLSTLTRLTPLALSAVISFSAASLLKSKGLNFAADTAKAAELKRKAEKAAAPKKAKAAPVAKKKA